MNRPTHPLKTGKCAEHSPGSLLFRPLERRLCSAALAACPESKAVLTSRTHSLGVNSLRRKATDVHQIAVRVVAYRRWQMHESG